MNVIQQSGGVAIRATGVEQRFGNGAKSVYTLRGVDLEIEAGTVYGLLGHNGAGKTTLVNILTTLVPPAAGHASVAGFDVERDAKQVRARIGLTGQYAAVDEDLTGRENLRMIGRLLGMPKATADARSRELLERFDLADASERRASTYSGGMRRRLDLGASLVGQPEVLFLDEPTTGLDPSSRVELWDVIAQLVDLGTTVLLTTQYLEEADRLADRIGVLDAGLMIAEGTAAELKSKVGGHVVEVSVGDGDALRSARDRARQPLGGGRRTHAHRHRARRRCRRRRTDRPRARRPRCRTHRAATPRAHARRRVLRTHRRAPCRRRSLPRRLTRPDVAVDSINPRTTK